MTKHYSLTTWMGQQMVRVEHLTADDDQRAVAYSRGRLDERHDGAGGTVLDLGVTYRLDRQTSDDPLIELTSGSRVGDWFSVRGDDRSELLWIEHQVEVGDLVEGLTERYGAPAIDRSDTMQVRSGAVFPRRSLQWRSGKQTITLIAPGEARDFLSLTFRQVDHAEAVEGDLREAVGSPASRL